MASSGIRDNHTYGKAGDFLSEKIKPNNTLSIISAYFSIYGFDPLSKQLSDINQCRFLFGEPRFIEQIDPTKTETKAFDITEQGSNHYHNNLNPFVKDSFKYTEDAGRCY